MEITQTLYVITRKAWRKWLEKNHDKKGDIWLVFYKKDSGKKSLSYDDAVEEALCFGWIDSIVKKIDEQGRAQRFSPRKAKSNLSELNRHRVKKMIKMKLMTPAGLEILKEHLKKEFKVPIDILKELKKDRETWKNWQKFPQTYKKIRTAFVDGARKRPAEFKKRLKYLVKMTAQNKTFGMGR